MDALKTLLNSVKKELWISWGDNLKLQYLDFLTKYLATLNVNYSSVLCVVGIISA